MAGVGAEWPNAALDPATVTALANMETRLQDLLEEYKAGSVLLFLYSPIVVILSPGHRRVIQRNPFEGTLR